MMMKVISKKYWLLDMLIFLAECWVVGWVISILPPTRAWWEILLYAIGMLVFFTIANMFIHMRLADKIYGPRLPTVGAEDLK